jgi:hypothetical protein
MNIKGIIKQELRRVEEYKDSIEEQLVNELSLLTESTNEGVADVAAEKMFNIPNQAKQQDYQATKAMPASNTKGEYIGDVVNDNNEFYGQSSAKPEVEARIFANPRSLDGFDNHTRAVSDVDGNLFVAEHNGRFFHQEIEEVVKVSKYGSSHTDYMQWYRQGGSNMFTWSATYSSTNQFKPEVEQEYILALQKKNPQYKFLVPQTQQATNEVIQSIVDGVADKYAEKQFGIPDNTKINSPGEKPFMTMTIETPAWLDGGKTEQIPVYMNPRSLQDFQSDVRAISDNNGNLYVAQLDGNFVHGQMARELGLTQDDGVGMKLYQQMNNFQLLHRVGDDNSFGLADSAAGYTRQDENSKKNSIALLRKVKSRNPQYEYYPEYYRNVEAYDTDPIDANGNDIYDEETYDEDNIGDDNGLTTKDFQEGVADKYAEKRFNIPDPNVAMNQRATAGIKDLPKDDEKPEDLSKGKFVGEFPVFDSGKYQQVPVYQNPRQLNDFDADVKAVSNKEGDLFVAQLDLAFYHDDIINSVKAGNIYPNPVYNAYDESENITWHRIDKGNEFGWSISYKRFGYKPENRKFVAEMMQAVMKKNPQYKFIPQYWQETKQIRYDKEHNINSDSLLNY